MPNLVEGLHNEICRVRDISKEYETVEQAVYARMLIRQDIIDAEKALASGDVVDMLHAYSKLKNIQ